MTELKVELSMLSLLYVASAVRKKASVAAELRQLVHLKQLPTRGGTFKSFVRCTLKWLVFLLSVYLFSRYSYHLDV